MCTLYVSSQRFIAAAAADTARFLQLCSCVLVQKKTRRDVLEQLTAAQQQYAHLRKLSERVMELVRDIFFSELLDLEIIVGYDCEFMADRARTNEENQTKKTTTNNRTGFSVLGGERGG